MKKQKTITVDLDKEKAESLGITIEQLDTFEKIARKLDVLKKMARKEDHISTQEEDRKKVGFLLAKSREMSGLSQRDIAKQLGYKGNNFIYLIERGKSKIPADKIDAFVTAYDADVKMSSAMIRAYHPEMWFAMLRQMEILAGVDIGKVDQEVYDWVESELKS